MSSGWKYKKPKNVQSYANRGAALEYLLEIACNHYRIKKLARIDKRPTPTKNVHGQIKYAKKSTVDFDGTIKGGRSVYFDAKSTRETTRFPLPNIKDHQLEFLEEQGELGAAVFFLIEFATKHEFYYLPYNVAAQYIEEAQEGGRKSIPYDDFLQHPGIYKIGPAPGIVLNFLEPIWEGKV